MSAKNVILQNIIIKMIVGLLIIGFCEQPVFAGKHKNRRKHRVSAKAAQAGSASGSGLAQEECVPPTPDAEVAPPQDEEAPESPERINLFDIIEGEGRGAVPRSDYTHVKSLLASFGKDLDLLSRNEKGETLLHVAVAMDLEHWVRALLEYVDPKEKQAFIDAPDGDENTAVHRAVAKNDCAIIRILCTHGATTLLKTNKEQATPFDVAIRAKLQQAAVMITFYESKGVYVKDGGYGQSSHYYFPVVSLAAAMGTMKRNANDLVADRLKCHQLPQRELDALLA
jgi:hypothetical protein